MPSDRPPPTVPPPRRRPTPPARPAVLTERESQVSSNPPQSRGMPDEEGEDFRKQLKAVEHRGREQLDEALRALSDVYEGKLAERDQEIEHLKESSRLASEADLTLQEAMIQLRKENNALREQTAAMVASAVTAEVSKHFVSTEEAQTMQDQGSRVTQVKSLVGALVLALVSSGALTAILRSCSDAPTVAPDAVKVTKPSGSAVPGAYGSR